jgi:hypothetical protein
MFFTNFFRNFIVMKKFFCALMVMTAVFGDGKVHAQFKDNYWAFGDSAYISWGSTGLPTVGTSAHTFRNGSASISDSNGILLYTGYNYYLSPVRPSIWNKYHIDITDNGKIFGGLWYHSSLFVPHPGNDSIIYLFTIGVTPASVYGFYSSIINYKANNDTGVVIQKNYQWNNFPAFDALMGVKHGNGRDWWVVSQQYSTSFTPFNSFYLFQITPQGVAIPFIQNAGSFRKTGGGHLIFNSVGTQFAQVSWMGMIELYNFDRCTGQIASTIAIEQEPTTGPYPNTFLSCAYSKDDSKLYIIQVDQSTATYYILQYDLLASNISASKFVVDSFMTPSAPWQMKLAPDDKIYISAFDENYSWPYPDTSTAFTNINNNLSVINYPDSLGAACDFQPFSFNLGTGRSYYGLPNNPDYELGAWVGSPCDTLSVGVDENVPEQEVFFQAWYNSEWNMIHVNASKLKGRTGSLRLFDMEGRLVFEKKVEVIAGGYVTGEIPMNAVVKGVYLVNLITDVESVSSKLVKF